MQLLFTPLFPRFTAYAQSGSEQGSNNGQDILLAPPKSDYKGYVPRPNFDRERIREELLALPAEERKIRLKQLKEIHERRVVAQQEKIDKKWRNASDDERDYFCQKLQHRCQEDRRHFICVFMHNKCGN